MRIPVLTGPTAVGKTAVAVRLAETLGLEVVSADSRQVYCWLDIGTDKPSVELRRRVKFHMLDKVQPDRTYSAADFARDALAAIRRRTEEGQRLMVVGGSGMYIRALFEPFFEAPKPDPELRARLEMEPSAELHRRLGEVDPVRAGKLHPNDRQRVMRALEIRHQTGRTMTELMRESSGRHEFEPAYIVLAMDRDRLYRHADERFDQMMRRGLIEEVRHLRELGFGRQSYVANAYGYAELLDYLDGRLDLDRAVELAKAKTRAYIRRQLTWCRSLPGARWVRFTDPEETTRLVQPMVTAVFG